MEGTPRKKVQERQRDCGSQLDCFEGYIGILDRPIAKDLVNKAWVGRDTGHRGTESS